MDSSVYPSIYALYNIQLFGYEQDRLTVPVSDIALQIGLQTFSPGVVRRKRFAVRTATDEQPCNGLI